MMQSGIITKDGIFIECQGWKHVATAFRHDTERQFILCRIQEGYGSTVPMLDLIGELNKKMIDALFNFATVNGVIVEEIAGNDLEQALKEYQL